MKGEEMSNLDKLLRERDVAATPEWPKFPIGHKFKNGLYKGWTVAGLGNIGERTYWLARGPQGWESCRVPASMLESEYK